MTAQVVVRSEQEPAPCCPRCGYDQSGMVATWNDSCPLRGVCSECGFEFDWARVINAEKYRLPWFYEHARGWRPAFRRAWRTWQRAIVPWRFWRTEGGLRLDSPYNGWRLLAWLPLLVACVWVIGGTLGLVDNLVHVFIGPGAGTFRARLSLGRWVDLIVQPYMAPIGQLERRPRAGWTLNPYALRQTPYVVKAWVTCCIVMPLMLLVLPRTRAMVRVRPIHVWRAAVYGMALLLVWPLELFSDAVARAMPDVNDWLFRMGMAHQSVFLSLQAIWAVLGVAWFALWWWIVLVRVFALPTGRWVWGLLMLACVLAACVVAAFSRDFAMLLFG